jgi:phage-related protein
MPTLPPELAAFSYLLDAQPTPMRDAFHYCLCLLMVEAGRMRLVEEVPGENGEICVFETVARVKFSVPKPVLSRDQEAALIDVLREILKDEGEL